MVSICTQTLIQRTSQSDPFCSLYRIIHYIKCNMLSKSSEQELGFVHYISKFTISRFIISRFECTTKYLQYRTLNLTTKKSQKAIEIGDFLRSKTRFLGLNHIVVLFVHPSSFLAFDLQWNLMFFQYFLAFWMNWSLNFS